MNKLTILTICIPAYNEEKNLAKIVEKVQNINFEHRVKLEIIIIDDCSNDKTLFVANKLAVRYKNITVLKNDRNIGKSQTLRKGFINVKKESHYTVCQDADLEYDPQDLSYMLDTLITQGYDVAYGNRFGHYTDILYKKNFYGNLTLSLFSALFTTPRIKVLLPDMEVCYKMIRSDIARDVSNKICSKSNFGIEPEITARLSRYKINDRHLKFVVTPTNYYPRSIEEGKKMRAVRDGAKAMFEIIRFNIFSR